MSNSVKATLKVLRQGTHRSESLDHTLDRALRLAPVMGITRVANVTGLDVVGIPVVMVSRPNSRSVTVSQGKGINLESARASGLMEAAELYHAETMTLPLRLASYQELRFKHTVVEIEDLPRGLGSHFHRNLRILWCHGHDLLNGEKVLVPYEMVHTNYTLPLPDGHGCFSASSNGLASGNNLIEAISQGICEVIERDAVALWKMAKKKGGDKERLDLDTVDDPICQSVLNEFGRAGLSIAVWDVTTDIRIAVFACLIVPQDDHSMWHCAASAGYGCHPAREIALLRALTEAAQTRLTVISGLRDDFRNETYEELLDPDVIELTRDQVRRSKPRRDFRKALTKNGKTLEADLAWELKCLKRAGVQRVIAIDLTKPEFGLSVVRVIVPGLEPIVGSGYSPGCRAKRAMAAKR
jgi:YcaO-like protein with predicted kinase domain